MKRSVFSDVTPLVRWKSFDASEEHISSIFRAEARNRHEEGSNSKSICFLCGHVNGDKVALRQTIIVSESCTDMKALWTAEHGACGVWLISAGWCEQPPRLSVIRTSLLFLRVFGLPQNRHVCYLCRIAQCSKRHGRRTLLSIIVSNICITIRRIRKCFGQNLRGFKWNT
jgi:hypothetical protein